VTPDHVTSLFVKCLARFPQARAWAFHAHDTYGLGAANTLAAFHAGVRVFDAAIAGLGGCPFAPGATGNVATEDLIWIFNGMNIETGIDLAALVTVAEQVAALPGGQIGGRVRDALAAKSRRERTSS
jgi:hydroxymethylglutaryl-CoA lyase